MRSLMIVLCGVTLVLVLAVGTVSLRQAGVCGLRGVMRQLDKPMVDDLQWAAASGKITQVKRILAERPDLVNRKGFDGWTPLHEAARGGYDGIVKLLIDRGASLKIRNNEGQTAFDCAVRAGCRTTATLLRRSEAVSTASTTRALIRLRHRTAAA